MDIDELMTAEEFFGTSASTERGPSGRCGSRGRRGSDKLFSDVKEKMVMRIHGVSRAKARGIIALREDELALENDGDGNGVRQ